MRHPGSTQEARDILETECVFSCVPVHQSDASNQARSDTNITVYHACAQEVTVRGVKIATRSKPNCKDTPPEPPTAATVRGIYHCLNDPPHRQHKNVHSAC